MPSHELPDPYAIRPDLAAVVDDLADAVARLVELHRPAFLEGVTVGVPGGFDAADLLSALTADLAARGLDFIDLEVTVASAPKLLSWRFDDGWAD